MLANLLPGERNNGAGRKVNVLRLQLFDIKKTTLPSFAPFLNGSTWTLLRATNCWLRGVYDYDAFAISKNHDNDTYYSTIC